MIENWPPEDLRKFAEQLPFEHLLRKRLPSEAIARWQVESHAQRRAPACVVGLLLDPDDSPNHMHQTLACWRLQTWYDVALLIVDEEPRKWRDIGPGRGDRTAVVAESDLPAVVADLGIDWLVPAKAGDLLHPSLAGIVAGHARRGARVVAWDWFLAKRQQEAVALVSRHRGPWRDGVAERSTDLRSRAFALPAAEWHGHPVRDAWRTRMAHSATLAEAGVHHEPLSILFDPSSSVSPDEVALSRCWGTPFVRCGAGGEPAHEAGSISVIMLYRDKPELTIRALESVCRQRISGRLELVLVDNESSSTTRAAIDRHLAGLPAHVERKVIVYDAPFNHSRQSNLGAAAATGEVLVFLNNDVELLDGDALAQLASWALVPGVASVGAGVVDSQGNVVGGGFRARRQPGAEFNSPVEEAGGAHAERSRCTVGNTFACAAVRADVFNKLGGLDEVSFPVGYNDVDFCLRATRDGWTHINLATVRVTHALGASRARTDEIAQKLALRCAHPWLATRALQEIDSEPVVFPETILGPVPMPPSTPGALP